MPGRQGRRDFLTVPREDAPKRPAELRVRDSREVEVSMTLPVLQAQGGRCMDCGVPFCHHGCPLGNRIPDWNELVHQGRRREAFEALHATNNFPEVTGRICPAPCEDACVLGLSGDAVTIRQIEKHVADWGFEEGWVLPAPAPRRRSGKRVAVVGSGPAGLAAAQQLVRVGHEVVVYERDDRPGGLLRYGIPDFKLEKPLLDRRLAQLEAEGVAFRCGVEVGAGVSGEALRRDHDAVLLATGAQRPRRLEIPGADLEGVVPAMAYLTAQNRAVASGTAPGIDARGRRVVILGGGDTGADCLGTAHRQGAATIAHYHYRPPPPEARTDEMPWPFVPMILRGSTSHEEGGHRGFGATATSFVGDDGGRLTGVRMVDVDWAPGEDGRAQMAERPGTERVVPADLALIAIGFSGTEDPGLVAALGGRTTGRGTIEVDDGFATGAPGVFACGDATRGASLVVWAIWEGREAARRVDLALMGTSSLPTSPHPHPLGAAPRSEGAGG